MCCWDSRLSTVRHRSGCAAWQQGDGRQHACAVVKVRESALGFACVCYPGQASFRASVAADYTWRSVIRRRHCEWSIRLHELSTAMCGSAAYHMSMLRESTYGTCAHVFREHDQQAYMCVCVCERLQTKLHSQQQPRSALHLSSGLLAAT